MEWREEDVARLKELWTEGLSARQISNAIGGVSRCAVLGKASRLGLAARKEPPVWKSDKPRAERRRPFQPFFGGVTDHSPIKCAPVDPLYLSLMELERNSCRYPYGGENGEPITFCGNLRHGESSYCAGHYRLTRNTRLGLSLSEAERERRRRRMQHIRSGLNSTEAA